MIKGVEESKLNDMVATDRTAVKEMIFKLLDKAGKDPRLTPRILREKAEQRLNMKRGELRPARRQIKTLIFDWWDQQQKGQSQDEKDQAEKDRLKLFVRLARLSGHTPAIFMGLSDTNSNHKKIQLIRERLRAKGVRFSDPAPTEAEIETAQREYEAKKDMDGLDPSNIIEDGARRGAKRQIETVSASTAATISSELKEEGVEAGAQNKRRAYATADDEDAEAEF